jgi:hypothetical protein
MTKVNHEETVKVLKKVGARANELYSMSKEFVDKIASMENDSLYSEDGIESFVKQYTEQLDAEVKRFIEDTQKDMEQAYEVEEENNKVVPLDDVELQNALNIIKLMENNIDAEVKQGIIDKYKGCYQAQLLIEKMFDSVGVKYDKFRMNVAMAIKSLSKYMMLKEGCSPKHACEKMAVVMETINIIYDELCVPGEEHITLPNGELEIKLIHDASLIINSQNGGVVKNFF